VLVTEDGTDDSMVGCDRACRQVAIPGAQRQGVELGDVVTAEITGNNTVYALGELV
jgi:tRNA A37 methylthiotransferase MiaB